MLTALSYQEQATATDKLDSAEGQLHKRRFGLFGQVGELLTLVKKNARENIPDGFRPMLEEEAGDILWYMASLAKVLGTDMGAVSLLATDKLKARFDIEYRSGCESKITFHQIDGLLAIVNGMNVLDNDTQLNGLGASCTKIMVSGDGVHAVDPLSDSPNEVLAEILANLALVSASFGISLQTVASKNIEKIRFRWRQLDAEYVSLVTTQEPSYERFPDQFNVKLIQRETSHGVHVYQQINGINIGDRLSDNMQEADGYRFHDVFHLAYVAHLGWSPVTRNLLKLKRKYDASIDENQDGARATITEEGIATWIFNHANRPENDLYKGVEEGKLAYSLLKQVHEMVRGYEVESCPLWQWERAILDGFKVFRQLIEEPPGGEIKVDVINHTIEYCPPTTAVD